jgi:hypothetical protein
MHSAGSDASSTGPPHISTSRSVTIIKRDLNEMSKEEIVRAKDAMILAQKRKIERLQQRIRILKDQLYTADRVHALAMGVLDLSLEGDEDTVE